MAFKENDPNMMMTTLEDWAPIEQYAYRQGGEGFAAVCLVAQVPTDTCRGAYERAMNFGKARINRHDFKALQDAVERGKRVLK